MRSPFIIFLAVNCNYANSLDYLKLPTLRERPYHIDSRFFEITVYLGSEFSTLLTFYLINIRSP
jgi:hypothetical protein